MNPAMLTRATRKSITPIAFPTEACGSIGVVEALSPAPHRLQYFKPCVVWSPQFGQYISSLHHESSASMPALRRTQSLRAHVVTNSRLERPRCILSHAHHRFLRRGDLRRRQFIPAKLGGARTCIRLLLSSDQPKQQPNKHSDDGERHAEFDDEQSHHIALRKPTVR